MDFHIQKLGTMLPIKIKGDWGFLADDDFTAPSKRTVFVDSVLAILNQRFHFGNGAHGPYEAWSTAQYADGSLTGTVFDRTAISVSERFAACIYREWMAESTEDGSIRFTKKFSTLKSCDRHGFFKVRNATHDSFGYKFFPEKVERTELEQIVQDRLMPIFGEYGYEIWPIDEKGNKLEPDELPEDTKFSHFQISVIISERNASQALLEKLSTIKKLGIDGFDEVQKRIDMGGR